MKFIASDWGKRTRAHSRSSNIANTHGIVAVWKDGKKVSDGPLTQK
jgi:hypothetical protein